VIVDRSWRPVKTMLHLVGFRDGCRSPYRIGSRISSDQGRLDRDIAVHGLRIRANPVRRLNQLSRDLTIDTYRVAPASVSFGS